MEAIRRITVDTGNVLHPGTHLGRVATKGQVAARWVQNKHIHVAVKQALSLGVTSRTKASRLPSAAAHRQRPLHQSHEPRQPIPAAA